MLLIELMLFAVINVHLLDLDGQLYCRAQATANHQSNRSVDQEHSIGNETHRAAYNSAPTNHRTNPNETAVPKPTQLDETADQSSGHGIALNVDFLERPDLFEIGQSFFMPSRRLPPVTQYQRVAPAPTTKQRNLDDSAPADKPTSSPRSWSVSFDPTNQADQSAIRVLNHAVGKPATSGQTPTSLIKFDDDDNELGQSAGNRLQEAGFVELNRLKGIEQELEHKLAVQARLPTGEGNQSEPHDSDGVKSNETGASALGRSSLILLQQSEEQMRGLLPVGKQTVQHPKNKLSNLGRFALTNLKGTNMKRADRFRPIPLGATVKMTALSRDEPQGLLVPSGPGHSQKGVGPTVGQFVATRQPLQESPSFALNEAPPGVSWHKPARAKYKPKTFQSDQTSAGVMLAHERNLYRTSKPRRRGQATKQPNYWSAELTPATAPSIHRQEAANSAPGPESVEDDEEDATGDEPGLDGLDLGVLGENYGANQVADFASYGAATHEGVSQVDGSQLIGPFAPGQTQAKHSYLDFTPSMPSLDEALRFGSHFPPAVPARPVSRGHSADAALAAYPMAAIARQPPLPPPRNQHQHRSRRPIGAPSERANRYRNRLLNVDLDHLELGGSHSHKVIHVHTKEKKKYGKYLWPILGGGLTMLMGFLIISNMLLSIPLLAIGASSLFNQGGYHTQQLVPIYNLSQLARPSGRRRRRRRETSSRYASGESLQLNQLAKLEPRELIERVLLSFASNNFKGRCRARAAP